MRRYLFIGAYIRIATSGTLFARELLLFVQTESLPHDNISLIENDNDSHVHDDEGRTGCTEKASDVDTSFVHVRKPWR